MGHRLGDVDGKATTPSVSERGEESFPLLSVKRETDVDKEVDKDVDKDVDRRICPRSRGCGSVGRETA